MANINKPTLVFILLVTAAFISLVSFAASGVRGSDQYWYVADVDTLLQGEPKTTNNVYPVHLMRQDFTATPYFIHDILNLYLVLPAAMIFGSFKGWIVTNIIATILTAWLIALVAAKVANKWIGVLVYAVYLLLPITVWQSAQPLAEVTIMPFIALGILIYIRPNKNEFMWVLLIVLASLAYYCRSSFSPLLIVIPIMYFIQNRTTGIKSIVYTLGFLCLAALVVIAKDIIFTDNGGSLRKLITAGVPGVTISMASYFSISPDPILLSNIYSKTVYNLTAQVLPGDLASQIFYLPFNILTAVSVYFFFTKKTNTQSRITHCGVILLLLHVATIVIHQNQFRYLLIATPILLLCAAVVINRIKFLQSKRIQIALILSVFIFLAVLNIPLAMKLHRQGLQERDLCTTLTGMFDETVPTDESLMVDTDNSLNLMMGYVLRPRTVVFIRPGYSYDDYRTMQERGNAKWLLCPINSPLIEHLNISSRPVRKDFPCPYDTYGLFAL